MVALKQGAQRIAPLPADFQPITQADAARLLTERMGATAIPSGLRWYLKRGTTADEMRCLYIAGAISYFLGGYGRVQAIGLVAVRP